MEFRQALAAVTALLAAGTTLSATDARVWEGTLPLRTTVEGEPSPNPPFDVFQATKFNYPYTLREYSVRELASGPLSSTCAVTRSGKLSQALRAT